MEQYQSYNCSDRFIYISQLIILFSQAINIIFTIIYYIFKKDFFEVIIVNILSFVLFLIFFKIEISLNNTCYTYIVKKLKFACLSLSEIFQGVVFVFGWSFCTFGCTRKHPLILLQGFTLLYMLVLSLTYIIIDIKLKIESIFKNRNKNNEQHLNTPEENNNTIDTPNEMNENIIGSDTSQN